MKKRWNRPICRTLKIEQLSKAIKAAAWSWPECWGIDAR